MEDRWHQMEDRWHQMEDRWHQRHQRGQMARSPPGWRRTPSEVRWHARRASFRQDLLHQRRGAPGNLQELYNAGGGGRGGEREEEEEEHILEEDGQQPRGSRERRRRMHPWIYAHTDDSRPEDRRARRVRRRSRGVRQNPRGSRSHRMAPLQPLQAAGRPRPAGRRGGGGGRPHAKAP
ncbi:unnamed protein product, partial [Prorocentrum cordatum]